MSLNKLAARMMNIILLAAIVLAIAGAIAMLVNTSASINLGFTQLNSSSFFSLAVFAVLLTPFIISLTAAISFLREKRIKMALCALMLLTVLSATIVMEMLKIS